jgi:hypothetical protein
LEPAVALHHHAGDLEQNAGHSVGLLGRCDMKQQFLVHATAVRVAEVVAVQAKGGQRRHALVTLVLAEPQDLHPRRRRLVSLGARGDWPEETLKCSTRPLT